MTNEQKIMFCAEAGHEMNRIYCASLGDFSQPAWVDAPAWQRESAMNGVKGVLEGNTPEESHKSWWAEKISTGWKYGPVKSQEKKEHPCMVEYEDLPEDQCMKDFLYITAVGAMATALGLLEG